MPALRLRGPSSISNTANATGEKREEKEREGKEKKRKERQGKERQGKTKKGKICNLVAQSLVRSWSLVLALHCLS